MTRGRLSAAPRCTALRSHLYKLFEPVRQPEGTLCIGAITVVVSPESVTSDLAGGQITAEVCNEGPVKNRAAKMVAFRHGRTLTVDIESHGLLPGGYLVAGLP
jgi:hypothetical protein